MLIQNGKAKVLADPKLTTISGRTASLRAGDNIAILTTAGGSVGTVATTQLQTFNTGVQLDITPVINADNYISVTLHPTVNNLSSVLNGVPQISTRDVQTTVALREGQSLIIGGLDRRFDTIEAIRKFRSSATCRSIGSALHAFDDQADQRNELVITVTPHIVDPLEHRGDAAGRTIDDAVADRRLRWRRLRRRRYCRIAFPAAARGERAASSFIALPPRPGAIAANTPTQAPAAAVAAAPSSVGGALRTRTGTRPPSVPSTGPNDPPKHSLRLKHRRNSVKQGTTISIEAVTTPNVTRAVVQLGSATISLRASEPRVLGARPFRSPMQNTSQMRARSPWSSTASRGDGVGDDAHDIPLTLLHVMKLARLSHRPFSPSPRAFSPPADARICKVGSVVPSATPDARRPTATAAGTCNTDTARRQTRRSDRDIAARDTHRSIRRSA